MASWQARQRDPLLDQGTQAMLERRGRELVGLALLALAVACLLMLGSYSPTDPGWMVATDQPAHNLMGRFGAAMASTLIIIGGKGVWSLPILFLAWGVRFVTHRGADRAIARVVFAVIAVALCSVFAATLVPSSSWPHSFGLGGLFGDTVLGAMLGVAPVNAGIGLTLLSLVLAVAMIAMMLFVTGFDMAELKVIQHFLMVGAVMAYNWGLTLAGRSAAGAGRAAAGWQERRNAQREERREIAARAPQRQAQNLAQHLAQPPVSAPAAPQAIAAAKSARSSIVRRAPAPAAYPDPVIEDEDDPQADLFAAPVAAPAWGSAAPLRAMPRQTEMRQAETRQPEMRQPEMLRADPRRADPRYGDPLAEAPHYAQPREKLGLLSRVPGLGRRAPEPPPAPQPELIEPEFVPLAALDMPPADRIKSRISEAVRTRTRTPETEMTRLQAAVQSRREPPVTRPRGPKPLIADTRRPVATPLPMAQRVEPPMIAPPALSVAAALIPDVPVSAAVTRPVLAAPTGPGAAYAPAPAPRSLQTEPLLRAEPAAELRATRPAAGAAVGWNDRWDEDADLQDADDLAPEDWRQDAMTRSRATSLATDNGGAMDHRHARPDAAGHGHDGYADDGDEDFGDDDFGGDDFGGDDFGAPRAQTWQSASAGPALRVPPPVTAEARRVVQPPVAKRPALSTRAMQEAQPGLHFHEPAHEYELPPLALLTNPDTIQRHTLSNDALEENARMLESVLDDYGVKGEIVSVRPGPVVTMYELEPAPGLKASRVIGLADDIARSMSALSARVSTVPGRSVIGIELPNTQREKVVLREILAARDFGDTQMRLPLALGKDIGGDPIVANLAKMPHLLIAGTTGSGKSVAINTMILSLLYKLTPEECRLIMIDPKMLELSVYDGIPHLLSPVVTDPKKAVVALKWVVGEMEERYRKMSKMGVRNIEGYNGRVREAMDKGEMFKRTIQTGFDEETGDPVFETEEFAPQPFPYIVVIVDEMADLMMVAGKEIEACIQRLAQMARASGIHLIMATQRPSVDVITGTIKANFPTRISFQVTSKIDSRTILGEQGAEQLLGMGDMLYMAGGGRISRIHGPFVSDEEVEEIVNHLKSFGPPTYMAGVVEGPDDDRADDIDAVLGLNTGGNTEGEDALYDQAVAIVAKDRKCSTSYIQRKLGIGYNKAARLVEQMEDQGVVTPANHVGKREILIPET